jgi:hypothetical protein
LGEKQTPRRKRPANRHYNGNFKLGLSDREKAELVEYLKSL